MPVCIKSESRTSAASVEPPLQAAPQSSPKPVTANGSASHARFQAAATSVHQNSGPQVSQTSNTFLPTSTMANPPNPPSAVPNTNGVAEKVTPANVSEAAIDYDSVRGVFGWATLDDINVPYIIRKGKRFVAVRIVEKKVLNKYPNSFPDELGRKEPLVSYFVTDAEASLLNEINTVHCSFEYGHQPFTNKDLIVDLVEFEDFYSIVKKTFPENVLASITADEYNKRSCADERKALLAKMCGWMQINNTVTPYIIRSLGKFVPLSVIQYAAQLLTKDQVEGHLPTVEECELLNDTCKAAGFEFTFARNTKLIHIAEVVQRCRVRIFELPFDSPLQHAQYIDSLNQGDGSGQPAPQVAPSGIVGSMSLPYQSKPSLSDGPPNMNPFNNPYDPFMSMMNMISQSPGTVPNHSHPRTNHASTTAPQLSVTHSQTAPVFYPPIPPAMSARGAQMSQTPRMVQGQQRMSGPPAMGNSGRASSSPHNQMGSPVSRSPQMQSHGNASVGGGSFPHVSSPSLTRLPPPPSYPGSHQPRQSVPHPAISSPPALAGTVSHPYMNSAQQTGRSDLVMSGSVSRAAGTMTAFPPGTSPSNRHLQSSQSQTQTQTGPPYQHVHPQSDVGVSTTPFQLPNSSVNPAGRPPHPGSNASAYPVQMSPATQHQGFPGRQPSLDIVTKSPGSLSTPTFVADEHLKLVNDIRAEMVNGKSISCMRRNSSERVGNFCLVEAVAKLYFPKCNLSEFVNALQNVLRINLPVCSEGEAKAFIHFYNLPVAKLNDNHMISLPDLKNYFPQISYMFRHAAADSNAMAMHQNSGARHSSGSEGPTKMVSPSTPISIVLNNNENSDVINLDSGPPTPVGHSPRGSTKRPVENNMVVGNKFSRSSLDQRGVRRGDEVDGNRARHTATTAAQSSSSSVIVID